MTRIPLLLGLVLTTSAFADEPRQRAMETLLTKASCPAVATTKANLAAFRATDELAPFGLSVEGFLRDDFGIPEAVALLGSPTTCIRSSSTYVAYSLAARAPAHRTVTLEVYDDVLVGVVINLDRPITLDVAALSDRVGSLRQIGNVASATITSATFRGQLLIRTDRDDPTKVASLIFRRTPMIEILPDRFQTADDVARLVALALAPRAPDPVRFYGTLGVFDRATSTVDRASLLPAIRTRNVASASIEHGLLGRRRAVTRLEVTFATPITGELAKTLGVAAGRTLSLAGGTVEFDGTHLVITRR